MQNTSYISCFITRVTRAKGNIMMTVLISTSVLAVIGISLISVVMSQTKIFKLKKVKIYAIHIAEAGANYYKWHLAHSPEDYQDGTGGPGPYEHNYYDAYGKLIGQFSLNIVPPPTGTTVVEITSKGYSNISANATRKIQIKYGKPSLTQYSFLTNSDIWLGPEENASGPFHANGGIRMDGTNNAEMTSAKETYICTSGHGCDNEEKPGIWGTGPNFNLWKFPVSAVDFNLISMDLATIKNDAYVNGHYYPKSNKKGYHIIFYNNGSYTIYEVTKLQSAIWQLNDDWTKLTKEAEQIDNETEIGTYGMPSNGLIFVEDNLWVEGEINGRITVASAEFPDVPNKNTNIIINNNINYVSRNGDHILGLIAQKNVKVPKHAPTDLQIDGFLLAQKGRVFRNYYSPRSIKNSIAVYGGIITNKIWTWSWVSGSGAVVDGYRTTNSIYDNDTKYSPPPGFPTSGEYDSISWKEQ